MNEFSISLRFVKRKKPAGFLAAYNSYFADKIKAFSDKSDAKIQVDRFV